MHLDDSVGVRDRFARDADWKATATPLQTAVVCIAAALISCAYTGFVFGISNNQFHLPIMERLYDEPQFAQDAFIQSLRYFSSGVWMALAKLPRFADGGKTLFAILFFSSRLLSFIGFVCCASLLGVNALRERLIFSAMVCVTPLMAGNSFAGHGGLFVQFFSHSEIANGTSLLAIFFAVKGRWTGAFSWAGATFFINAFMGVWLFVPLLFIGTLVVRDGSQSHRELIRQAMPGAVVFAILAAPVVFNVLSNPDLRATVDFDFTAFLKEWYGDHFLIASNSSYDMLMLLAVIWLGWLSFAGLEGYAQKFRAAFLACLAIYTFGILAPSIAPSPTIFKLHLLRISVVIQMLTALGACALATKWLCSRDRSQATVSGPSLLMCLCTVASALPLAGLVAMLATRARPRLASSTFWTVIVGAVLATASWQLSQNAHSNRDLAAAVADWRAVGSWARNTTAAESSFLILTTSAGLLETMPETDARRTLTLWTAAAAFEAAAHRRVWVDFFMGGTTLFQPSYYREWHSRISDVLTLRTLSEKLGYARRHGILYVVDDCVLFEAQNSSPLYRSGQLCAAAANPS